MAYCSFPLEWWWKTRTIFWMNADVDYDGNSQQLGRSVSLSDGELKLKISNLTMTLSATDRKFYEIHQQKLFNEAFFTFQLFGSVEHVKSLIFCFESLIRMSNTSRIMWVEKSTRKTVETFGSFSFSTSALCLAREFIAVLNEYVSCWKLVGKLLFFLFCQ